MDVFAAGQHAGVADRVAAGARQHVFAIEGLEQALHFHVGADLLEAEAQVAKQFVEFGLIHPAKAGTAAGAQPGSGQLETEALQQGKQPGEVLAQGHPAIGAGDGLHHRSHRSTAHLGDDAVELHIGEHAGVIALVDVADRAAPALGKQGRQGTQAIFVSLQGGDIDQGCDRLLGSWWLADRVQAAGQQAAFDLHQLAVHRTHHGIPGVQVQLGGI